ncbi:hypothetical protein OEZ85_001986 [Tetradesmus obliquus]|uniref:Uncharacterized protein n=1 Tax=Tetradesmus obliquus TaxID=3088 RepID=A0ABY8U275_TETOB|nr:hypothetical protein OEZ85_001986 [Tetradesmus obliquus]
MKKDAAEFHNAAAYHRLAELQLRCGDYSEAQKSLDGALTGWRTWQNRRGQLHSMLVDRLRPGWQSLAYFHDIVQLATSAGQQQQQQQAQAVSAMETAAAAGDDTMAICLVLLQEKHSIFAERLNQHVMLLYAIGGQLSQQDWRSYRLNTPTGNHAMRSKLEAALQAKDPNAARHDLASLLLVSVRHVQEETPGSEALLVKSNLPPVADTPAARAAFAELFYTVYSRLAKLARSFTIETPAAALLMRIMWVQAADCGKLAKAAFDFSGDCGHKYAVSQLHVHSAASSPAMAALLLGPSPLPEHCLSAVAVAQASLACTATQLLASCTDIPASTGAVQPLTAFGMLSYCSNQAEHMLAIIQLLLQADWPEAKLLWAPLVAAAGDASQLPPELQPYHPHMTAALANWLARVDGGQLAAKALLLELLEAPQQDSSSSSSSASVEQQQLQRLMGLLLRTLLTRHPALSNLGVSDLAELLCRPIQLSTSERQQLVMAALLQAAYAGAGSFEQLTGLWQQALRSSSPAAAADYCGCCLLAM